MFFLYFLKIGQLGSELQPTGSRKSTIKTRSSAMTEVQCNAFVNIEKSLQSMNVPDIYNQDYHSCCYQMAVRHITLCLCTVVSTSFSRTIFKTPPLLKWMWLPVTLTTP